MLLNENLLLLFLHTIQQAFFTALQHTLIDWSTTPFVSLLQLVFAASAPPGLCRMNFLTHFFNSSPPTQLHLVFADSTSPATLQFQLCQLVFDDNQSRMFQTFKFDYTNIIELTQNKLVDSL